MQYIKGIDAFREEKRTAVTLGKFDGLHRGHQKLIEKIRSYAGNDCVSVVCAFDMQRSCLMTKEERKKLLAGKVDYLEISPAVAMRLHCARLRNWFMSLAALPASPIRK